MKPPKIPKSLLENQRILTDNQIKEAKEMLKTNSQRFVAKYFNVSRTTIVRHCVAGMKKYFIKKAREWDKNNPEKAKERIRKQAIKAYHKIADSSPEEMKLYRKFVKEKIGKEYFKLKAREFRKNHPNYHRRFTN